VLLILTAQPMRPGPAADLPVCANRTINAAVERVGCTLGDSRCWSAAGGFCTDYVERWLQTRLAGQEARLVRVGREEVRRGDVATFLARVHYAVVERVVFDREGRPAAVDLSEYNFGTCWVDEELMVTDQYLVVNRRSDVPLGAVDGGFLRAVPAGAVPPRRPDPPRAQDAPPGRSPSG
jgi:hypothetical protein